MIFIGACKVSVNSDDSPDPAPAVERSASYKVGATAVTVSKPYDGIFDNNGVVTNAVTLAGSDGSQITFSFQGTSAATYQLKGYPDAVYTNAAGAKFNATSGTLVITSYKVSGASYRFSGTFSFVGKAITNDQTQIAISNGVITNCSNDL